MAITTSYLKMLSHQVILVRLTGHTGGKVVGVEEVWMFEKVHFTVCEMVRVVSFTNKQDL